jgi:YesN/AraC family two-component response regulator
MISIKDNGAGMTSEEVNHAFEYFYQSHSSLHASKGSGIGLSLSKKLVQLMGGSISIESKEDVGTSILLKLPITRQAERVDTLQPQKQQNKGVTFSNGKISVPELNTSSEFEILIIEDNDSLRHILQTQLDTYNVITANNGQEGIDKAKQKVPDLVISDIMMPVKDGYQVCMELKEDLVTSHIPIILLTAKANHTSKIEGLKAKADAYINKPYDIDELELTIQNLIESRKLFHRQFQTLHKGAAPTALPDEDRFILEIREIVESHLKDRDFNIEKLCTLLSISRAQLYRKLKSLTGLSVSNYITLVRLQQAKEMLESRDANITEIAYEVGISSQSYFSTKFKEEFGVSPKQYRDSLVSGKV